MALGAHVSVEKGLHNAPGKGDLLNCRAIQIFTRNQRRWEHKPVGEEEAAVFQKALSASLVEQVVVHGSYLINLASTKPEVEAKSFEAFLAEAVRDDVLGLDRLVFHPGAHLGAGVAEGRRKIADALRRTLDQTQGSHVRFLLETMAGQGTTLGDDFSDLGWILDEAADDDRLGVCLDTCHLLAAGHDIRTPETYDKTMEAFDAAVGRRRVHAVHLNDSQLGLGERRDRHANIGEGHIGTQGFAPLLKDPMLRSVPMVLETPKAESGYPEDLRRLRSLL